MFLPDLVGHAKGSLGGVILLTALLRSAKFTYLLQPAGRCGWRL